MKSSIVSSLVLLNLLPFKPSFAHPTSWSQVETENNAGWAKYLADEPSEYHNLPLEWELGTSIPSWIKGSYVKNGPGRRNFGDERHHSCGWNNTNRYLWWLQGGQKQGPSRTK